MKKIALIIFLSCNTIFLFAQSEKTVKTIALLQHYSGEAKYLTVSDPARGGEFKYLITSSPVDNGVIFKAIGKSRGCWLRMNINEVLPEWWGTNSNNSRSFIQSALNYGSTSGKRIILSARLYQTDSTLIIPSNTDLEIRPTTTIRMKNGSNRPMFQNKNAIRAGSPKVNADSNITIHGRGVIAGGIQTLSTKDSVLNATISLNNVKNIHISDIRIDTTYAYAVFISSFQYIYISKIDIENRNMPYGSNDDGIHFAGPGKTAYVDACIIRCSDDGIAVLANELKFKYKTDTGGDISDIHFSNIRFNNASFGFRFIASSANIYRCSIDNTTGTILKRVLEFGDYGLKPTGGIMDRISVNNTNVNAIMTDRSKPLIYFNQGNYGTISLSNTTINGNILSNSLIRFGNGKGSTTVKNIIITNYRKIAPNDLSSYDRYILNVYIVFVASWANSLFYLTCIFIYHFKINKNSPLTNTMLKEHFNIIERKFWYKISTPFMLASLVLLLLTILKDMNMHEISLRFKLGCTLLLIAYHFICLHIINHLRLK